LKVLSVAGEELTSLLVHAEQPVREVKLTLETKLEVPVQYMALVAQDEELSAGKQLQRLGIHVVIDQRRLLVDGDDDGYRA